MSASNGRPLGATAMRSGDAAPARRTVRKCRLVVRSNWLKTTLPWNSLTPVAAPGVATVWALAAAGSAPRAAAVAMAMARRRMLSPSTRGVGGSDADGAEAGAVDTLRHVQRFDVLRDLLRRRRSDEDACDAWVLQGERDRQCRGWCFQLRTEGEERLPGGKGSGVLRVVSLFLDAAVRGAGRVLAGEGAGGERRRGDDARAARVQRFDRLGVLDRRAAHEAVRELDRGRHRDALALRAPGRLGEEVGGPVEQPPRAELPALDQRPDL